MTDAMTQKFADLLFENGLRSPQSTIAVIAFNEVLQITDAKVDAVARSLAGLTDELWYDLSEENDPSTVAALNYYRDQARAALEAERNVV